MNLFDIYTSVCSCQNTNLKCPGVINNPSAGIPPRGFYTKESLAALASVKILIVGKNPGHVLEYEKSLYFNQPIERLAKIHMDFANQTFSTCNSVEAKKNRSLKFHRNLLRYFSYFLDVSQNDVFLHCAYTNVVKCQTIGEQDRLDKRTIKECLKTHFHIEMDFFSPKVIIALGNEAYTALTKLNIEIPIFKLKHPSYHYRKEDEAKILKTLKNKIHEVL